MSQHTIPFVDQLQGADPQLIERPYGNINDQEAAKRFGARTLKEFSFWAWRACALANLAMIFRAENLFEGTLFDLVQEALQCNGYAFHSLRGGQDVGWKHSALIHLANKRGLCAKSFRFANSASIMTALKQGKYVLASMHSTTGSHIVLVKDFTLKNDCDVEFLVNNPFVFEGAGGEDITINKQNFDKNFLRKGVVVWAKN